ncbi:MAG: TonB-dependent receptor [Bacteroidota bacterium]
MKRQRILFFLFLLIGLPASEAQSLLDRRYDFVVDQLTIPEALRALSDQTGVSIAFSDGFFSTDKRWTHRFRQQKLTHILKTLLRATPVQFEQYGQQIIISKRALPPPRYTLSGYIQTVEDGEKLIAATLYCPQHQAGTVTNEYGFFSLRLPAGKTRLRASYLGAAEKEIEIELGANRELLIELEQSVTLAEVEVVPEERRSRQLFGGSPSVSEWAIGQLDRAPDLGGESDLFRAAQLMPGVQTGADGLGGLHIRGGNPDQNLLLLDGVTIYNANHLLGIFSIFNTEAIRDAKLVKGNFSARYGGRISSVFDVHTREGNEKNWGGDMGLGLVTARATIEGPLFKKRGAILLSARRTHLPLLFERSIRDVFYPSELGSLNFRFVDINGKINFKLSPRHRIFLSWYQGGDAFGTFQDERRIEDATERYSSFESELRWGNRLTSLRWNYQGSNRFFLQSTLAHSRYVYSNSTLEENLVEPDSELVEGDYELFLFGTGIIDWAFSTDAHYTPSPQHSIRLGAGLTVHEFTPNIGYAQGDIAELEQDDVSLSFFDDLFGEPVIYALSAHLYAQDDFRVGQKWWINAGLRLSSFATELQNYANLEPRLSLRYQLAPRWQLRWGMSRMVQYLHRISPAGLTKPDDLWIPSSDILAPQRAWQGDLGFNYGNAVDWELSVELYGKWMDNVLAFDDETSIVELSSGFEDDLYSGTGRAVGLEVLLRREFRRTGGQLGYNLAWTNRQFDGINLDAPFPFIYDRRHQLSLFLFHQFNDHFELSLAWLFGSQHPVIALSEDLTTGFNRLPVDPAGQRNQTRNRPYHRLDLSARYQLTGPHFQHRFKAGLYNSYNRTNEALQRPQEDSDEREAVAFLPFLPAFSYLLRF